jgi:hypothetical protein
MPITPQALAASKAAAAAPLAVVLHADADLAGRRQEGDGGVAGPRNRISPQQLVWRIPVKSALPLYKKTMAPVSSFMTPLMTRVATASLLLLLAACSPVFNWREVRPDNTALTLLLPCKPDKAQRSVPLGGRPTELAMLGCDAGDATFAVALATLDDAAQAAAVLAGWQTATLANLQAAGGGQAGPLALPGADGLPPAVLVRASGRRADGRAVQSQAAYFSKGRQVFQAVIYADRIDPEVAETFFSSLRLEAGSAR